MDGVFQAVEDQNDSILAIIGGAICWIFAPQGFGDWQAASATITGLIAKENVVSTFGILYDGDAGWYANVQAAFTYASGYAFLAASNLAVRSVLRGNGRHQARDEQRQVVLRSKSAISAESAWVVSLWVYQFAGLAVGEVSFNVFTVLAIATFIAFLCVCCSVRTSGRATLPFVRLMKA